MRHMYYRGSLRSCNYDCSYCPFSKNRSSARQLERDREEWMRFVGYIEQVGSGGADGFSGTVQVVPYGEALIHPHYWLGLAKLSSLPHIRAVGAQSNFSFSVPQMLSQFEESGGNVRKLRLWGTFHPEMTEIGEFLGQCEKLSAAGVSFCVGCVGVPEWIGQLRQLRAGLHSSVYMWVNKMDGLGREYTDEERRQFLRIDPYFALELRQVSADAAHCSESVLVAGNGDVYPCNLCRRKMGNLYGDGLSGLRERNCTRDVCSCYLAYGNRSDIVELGDFQPEPAFRIPICKESREDEAAQG